ncbi:MAG: hypothetical protein CTY31_11060 [Hyphomicrobium sp.]|nr:MAG: hypothetical protein CTY31_11060 [Hyphomicrobium sp.]
MTSSELTTVSQINVSGDGGHYNRIQAPKLDIALKLSAKFLADEANVKIIRAELFLKSDGQPDTQRATLTFDGTAPVRALAMNKSFRLSFQDQGPVAQAAIAACNAVPEIERSLKTPKTVTFNTPVLWRVTTGKFNFKWTAYDHVAPSDDIVNNPDVYAERETQEAELLVTATATCAPLGSLPSIASKQAPMKAVPKLEAKLATVQNPIVQPAAVKTAALEQPAKTTCTGGMLREIANDTSICLCPGNTHRIQQSPDAFACVRKSARR